MSCEHIREELLQGSTKDFAKLQPHLDGCPGCAQIAHDARESEDILQRYLNDFSDAAPPNWDAAVATVGASARPSRLHGVAIFLTAAAVLTLVLVTQISAGRAGAGVADDDAVALMATFEDLETRVVDVKGLDRAAEDAVYGALLTEKAERLGDAEVAWLDLASETEPQLQVVAQIGLGDLYQSMGDCLKDFQHPSYLNEDQSDVYDVALTEKAMAHWDKAIAAYQLGLTVAEEEGFEEDAQVLRAEITGLEGQIEAIVAAEVAAEAAEMAEGRLVEARVIAAVEALEQQIADCPAMEEEVQQVLDQTHMVLDAQEYSMYGAFLEMLVAHQKAVAEACD